MRLSTLVMVRGPARFNMVGQIMPYSLHDTDQPISTGLVKRLVVYAERAMAQAGFPVTDWPCEVYTMDGDLPLSERVYCVEYVNAKGGRIGLQGIHTGRGGHPFIDHGFSIDIGEPA